MHSTFVKFCLKRGSNAWFWEVGYYVCNSSIMHDLWEVGYDVCMIHDFEREVLHNRERETDIIEYHTS